MTGFPAFQEQAARTTGEVDAVFVFIIAIGLFFFLLTQGFLIYFAVKYRQRRGEEERETPYITHNGILEFLWVVIPSLLVLAIFVVGFQVYRDLGRPLPGAMEVQVTARQWLWEFGYPDGRKLVNELRLPAGKPARLVMTSKDVIHSLFIPDYRVKQDVLPGRYTELWLQPQRSGTFVIHCAEYCGAGHSTMDASLIVMPEADYEKWEEAKEGEKKGETLEHKGEELVEKKGCLACHSLDGSRKIGPTLKGLFGHQVELADGSTVIADETYLRESLLDPGAKVVKGFQPIMPAFKGMLSDDEIAAIIVYLKTLK